MNIYEYLQINLPNGLAFVESAQRVLIWELVRIKKKHGNIFLDLDWKSGTVSILEFKLMNGNFFLI